jgi:hypothetical protein
MENGQFQRVFIHWGYIYTAICFRIIMDDGWVKHQLHDPGEDSTVPFGFVSRMGWC